MGFNLYVFDIKNQTIFAVAQPFRKEFKFDRVVPANINGYDLFLINNLLSISSDGQRHFDLTSAQFFHNIIFSFHC